MIKFIAFSDMLCPYDDSAPGNIPPVCAKKINEVSEAASDCRFIATLGNTVDGSAGDEKSASLLNNILNSLDKTVSVHALMGDRDGVIPKAEFMRVAEYTMRYRAFDVSDYRCIFLDAVSDGDGRFFIDEEQLGWISRLLGKSHRPAIVFTHIPLAVTSPESEELTVKNAAVLCELMEKSNKVALVVQGHLHASDHFISHGVPYITLAPMSASDEATFAGVSVSSKGIKVTGFGEQDSYEIANVFTTSKASFLTKVRMFFKKY